MNILQGKGRAARALLPQGLGRRRGARRKGEAEDFSQLLDEWLGSVRPRLKATTFAAYSTIAERHLRPAFGALRVGELTEDEVREFIAAQSAPPLSLAPSTVRGIVNVLRAVLGYAASLGCRVSPAACRAPARAGGCGAAVFSDAEQERIACFCAAKPSEKNLGILICLHTGLRLGELCALKWGDISGESGVLSVSRTLSRIKSDGGESATELFFGEPKSRTSRRQIPLSPQLWELLNARRLSDDCFVLSGNAEKPVEPRSMQRHFKTVLRQAGVADRNFHALRHSFATKCIERGFDAKALSLILGHSDVSVTLNTYVHPSVDRLRSMMALLDK